MLDYRIGDAYADVSRAALDKHDLDHEQRLNAASLLQTLYRAGQASGLPDDPRAWPGGHPAGYVVGLIVHADGPQQVEVSCGASSPWAFREVAAEEQAALDVQREHMDRDRIAQKEGRIRDLLEWADQMVVDDDTLPEPDELEEYDAGLR